MTIDTRRSLLLPALLAVLAVVAACSSPSGAASPSAAAPSVAASEAPSEAPASEPASEAPASAAASGGAAVTELKVAESSLGQIITDGAGMTLYAFTPDEAGTPTCYDGCAEAWPPVVGGDTTGITVGAGMDATKLSTVERTDGIRQLKYGTWPLYYFANDAAAGDVNGQGLNEVWYVIAPSGEIIK